MQLSAVTLHSLASFGWFTLIHTEPVNGPSPWGKNKVSKNPTWLLINTHSCYDLEHPLANLHNRIQEHAL